MIPVIYLISYYSSGVIGDIWPFPLLYFIEITLLGLLPLIALGMIGNDPISKWSGVPWTCSGILVAFVILGAWTIGFYFIPAMITFLITGILVDKRLQGDIALHIIFFVSAGIGQAVFVLISLLG